VAERCGFVREGVLRNYDDDGDCVMFSLVPADLAGE
jgi:RimJ/RimL family protein N-acetyltransferase